jgi:hypothetical protein
LKLIKVGGSAKTSVVAGINFVVLLKHFYVIRARVNGNYGKP